MNVVARVVAGCLATTVMVPIMVGSLVGTLAYLRSEVKSMKEPIFVEAKIIDE